MTRLGILATHPIQYHAPLYREMARRGGVDLTVYFAYRPTPEEQGEGFGVPFAWDVDLLSGYRHRFLINIARHPTRGFNGYDTPEISSIIARERYDYFMVHGWNNRSCWQAFRACWGSGTPLAVRSDSQLPQGRISLIQLVKQQVKRVVYPHFIRHFDLCLPYGQRSADYFQYFGARRIVIAHHFVDNDYFAHQAALYAPRRGEFRRRWGIPADAFCFLFCGKFIPQKRPMDLVRALDRLVNTADPTRDERSPNTFNVAPKSRHSVSNSRPLHLLMVGDGALRQECERYAASLALPVSFAGFVNQGEIASAYVASDCLVLPSVSETWGLVVNETMACGLPTIVSDACGCVPDLIKDGVTGYAYPAGETVLLTRKMAHLARDLDLARKLSVSAAACVNRFTAAVAADTLLDEMRGCPCEH